MNFDFKSAAQAKETGKRLSAGINKAKFEGIEFSTIHSQNGADYNVLSLKLDVEGHGAYTQNFFEPDSNERKEGMYGPSPSKLDHFLVSVTQIMTALDPKFKEALESGAISGNFKQVVSTVAKMTAPYIGTEVEVKFIPGNNGYVNMPSFPAKLTRNGDLAFATTFIGHDLTLTPRELKLVNEAEKATPTNMAAKTPSTEVADMISDLKSDLNISSSSDDSDLPF